MREPAIGKSFGAGTSAAERCRALFLRSAGGKGAGPVAGRHNSSFYGPGLRPGP